MITEITEIDLITSSEFQAKCEIENGPCKIEPTLVIVGWDLDVQLGQGKATYSVKPLKAILNTEMLNEDDSEVGYSSVALDLSEYETTVDMGGCAPGEIFPYGIVIDMNNKTIKIEA